MQRGPGKPKRSERHLTMHSLPKCDRGWRGIRRRRYPRSWPQQPLDGPFEIIRAGRHFERRRGSIVGEKLEEEVALEERQVRHDAASQEARQPMIGVPLVGQRRLDVAELTGLV